MFSLWTLFPAPGEKYKEYKDIFPHISFSRLHFFCLIMLFLKDLFVLSDLLKPAFEKSKFSTNLKK